MGPGTGLVPMDRPPPPRGAGERPQPQGHSPARFWARVAGQRETDLLGLCRHQSGQGRGPSGQSLWGRPGLRPRCRGRRSGGRSASDAAGLAVPTRSGSAWLRPPEGADMPTLGAGNLAPETPPSFLTGLRPLPWTRDPSGQAGGRDPPRFRVKSAGTWPQRRGPPTCSPGAAGGAAGRWRPPS